MATIKFFIQSKKSIAGIYVRLKEGRNVDAKAKTKFIINPEEWSANKGKPKNLKDVQFKILNSELQKLSSKLLTDFNNNVGKVEINSEWLKNVLNPPENEISLPNSLVEYFEYYISQNKNKLTPSKESTLRKISVFKKMVIAYEKEIKKKIFLKDVNIEFANKFNEFCKQDLYSVNTISRCIKYIKTMAIDARINGLETSIQIDRIKVVFEDTEKIYLTPNEIELIKNTKLSKDYLKNARDWLIISCETGQRISDFLRFEKHDISYKYDIPLLEFKQVKTGRLMSIPFTPFLEKFLVEKNWQFPHKISDKCYNEYIKEVCKIAGLDTLIEGSKIEIIDDGIKKRKRKVKGLYPKYELTTSHIGRRSFASNYYAKYPTPLLMNVTGHTTEKAFLAYIGKSNSEMALQLAQYFKDGKNGS